MLKDIYEYIELPIAERQIHLDLNSECLQFTDQKSTSVHHAARGILAWNLMTTIPSGMKIHLCHACNNKLCSNPKHLYWGTPKENHLDQVAAGTYKSLYQRTKDKYGEEGYRNITKLAGAKGGKAFAEAYSKDKTLSPNKLSDDEIKNIVDLVLTEPKTRGYISRLSEKLNVSHTQIRRYIKKYVQQ